MPEPGYTGLEGRLRWIEEAISATREWSTQAGAEGKTEWMFARESFDMDYSTDLMAAAERAEKTIEALEAEREAILARLALLDRDTEAGKYKE